MEDKRLLKKPQIYFQDTENESVHENRLRLPSGTISVDILVSVLHDCVDPLCWIRLGIQTVSEHSGTFNL